MDLTKEYLPRNDLEIIQSLLKQSKHDPPELEDIWQLMDNVWDEFGCNNITLDRDRINRFYKHPVWILNGLFIEQHELSMQHRHSISNWIKREKIKSVLDYGGGFGTLSRLIASKNASVLIDIYEPHPGKYAISKTKDYPNIRFVKSFKQAYDCLTCIDVLEHVPDPLSLLSKMIESVSVGGYFLVANNFYPVIKCHLPSTFHFRYTFDRFARIMGLELIGSCEGSHAIIYRKKEAVNFNWHKIRFYEQFSRRLFSLIDTVIPYWRIIKKFKMRLSNHKVI